MGDNRFGKTSQLRLKAINKNGKTKLEDCYFTAPFKIAKPFYKEEEMKLILMSASAGIMAGDMQKFEIEIKEGAKVCFTTQSYEKLHKMEEGCGRREATIRVSKNASLSYIPLCTIPFAESSFEGITNIHLEDETARLFFAEVFATGRKAYGESFKYRYYSSKTTVWQREEIIYMDNTYYEPDEMDMRGYGMFEGESHLVNILLVNEREPKRLLEKIRQYIEDNSLDGGTSLSDTGNINVKVLGKSAQELEEIVKQIDLLRR